MTAQPQPAAQHRRPHRPQRHAGASPSTAGTTPATPATPSPPRCWPTACIQVGTSIKLGRPRGIIAAGVEDPNALVQIERPVPRADAAPATTVELYDGLVADGLPGQGRLARTPTRRRYDDDARPLRRARRRRAARPAWPPRATAARDRRPGHPGRRPARARRRAAVGSRPTSIDGSPPWTGWPTSAPSSPPRPRCTRPAAHHRLRPLRRQLRPRRCERAPTTSAPPRRAGVSRQRVWRIRAAPGRPRHRRPRAPARLRRQRPPRHHARRRGPHLPAPLRRGRRLAGRGRSPPTTAPTPPPPTCRAAGVEVAAVVDARPQLTATGRRSCARRGIAGADRQRRGRHHAATARRHLGVTVRRIDDDGELSSAPNGDRLRPAARLRRLEPGGAPVQPGRRQAALRRRPRRLRARQRGPTASRSPAPAAAASTSPSCLRRRRRAPAPRRSVAARASAPPPIRCRRRGRARRPPHRAALAGARAGRRPGDWHHPVRRPAARRDRRRRRSAPSAPACARSSTSSATPRSAPPTTRARPPA